MDYMNVEAMQIALEMLRGERKLLEAKLSAAQEEAKSYRDELEAHSDMGLYHNSVHCLREYLEDTSDRIKALLSTRGASQIKPDQWATLETGGEANGCYRCDTCPGFRAHGQPCAFCEGRLKAEKIGNTQAIRNYAFEEAARWADQQVPMCSPNHYSAGIRAFKSKLEQIAVRGCGYEPGVENSGPVGDCDEEG